MKIGNRIRLKKAGIPTKSVVVILMLILVITLWNNHRSTQNAKNDVATLKEELAMQEVRNAELQNAIENRENLEYQKDMARDKLGLLEPGEKIFHITD